MSSKKRYTHSFVLTFILYALFFVVLFFSFDAVVKRKVINKDKTISLNHISLIAQEKTIKKVEKKEIVKPKEVEKKVIEKTKAPQKIKPKKEPKKEKPKEKKKENESEAKQTQEAIKKATSKRYEDDFLDQNLEKIVKLIQKNVKYPKRARNLNIQGKVIVMFTILTNGKIENLEALDGHRFLINSTLEAIRSAALDFPKVKKDITIKVPIAYILK
ncbi:MAG: energy transducer TonB [Candidatus Marinarcus sp.]|uniref:energy transducer TonB n=1 Tax=Candidatus Marinarcus sp. TaxID=3100987 RepID=UPI003AFFDFD8